MLKRFLRALARRHRDRLGRAAPRARRIRFEPLESRHLLAARFWDGGPSGVGTSWSDPVNWDNDTLPGTGDDVTINVAANPTIIVSSNVTINTLKTHEPITFSSGLFTASTVELVGIGASLSGATLKLLSVTGTGTMQVTSPGGTLDGVMLGVNTTVRQGAQATVLNSLSLDNSILRVERPDTAQFFSADVGLNFSGGVQTLGGVGELELYGPAILAPPGPPTNTDASLRVRPTGGGSLTIGPGVTVRTVPGSFLATLGDPAGGALSIAGRIQSQAGTLRVTGSSVTVNSTGVLETLAGTLDANNLSGAVNGLSLIGGTLDLDGNYLLNKAVGVSTGNLTLRGTWDNDSSITQTGGTINLGGTFQVEDLGTFTGIGGTVSIFGTLSDPGALLTIDSARQWQLAGGTIRGVRIGGGGDTNKPFQITPASGTLDGVTLGWNTTVRQGAQATVLNSLSLDNSILRVERPDTAQFFSADVGLNFSGGVQTLGGVGELELYGPAILAPPGPPTNTDASLRVRPTGGGSLTIGPGVTVRTVPGSFLATLGDPAGGALSIAGRIQSQAGTLRVTGSSVTVNSTGVLETLAGTLDANNLSGAVNGLSLIGGTLDLDGNYLLNKAVGVSTGNLTLRGTWDNDSSITQTGGTINLGGTFQVEDLGTFTGIGGTVSIFGTLSDPGALLTIDSARQWQLAGGTIRGVRIGGGGDTNKPFQITPASGTLDGVTLGWNTTVRQGAQATVLNSLSLDNSILRVERPDTAQFFSADVGLNFSGGVQTLGGVGELELYGPAILAPPGPPTNTDASLRVRPTGGGSLTIGPGVTVRTVPGSFLATLGDPAGGALSIAGRIQSQAGTLRVTGSSVTVNSTGVLETLAGTLDANNLSGAVNGLSLIGGTLDLDGNYLLNKAVGVSTGNLTLRGTWDNDSSITQTGGTINLGGTFQVEDLGTFTGIGGTVSIFGTLSDPGALLTIDSARQWQLAGGTIRGVRIGGGGDTNKPFQITPASGTLDGVTLGWNTTVRQGAQATVLNSLSLDNSILRVERPDTAQFFSADVGLNFSGGVQTLGGVGELELYGPAILAPPGPPTNTDASLRVRPTGGGSLTIGPGVTVRTVPGSFLATLGDPAGGALSIAGRILANAGTLHVTGTTVSNAGSLEVATGTLDVDKLTGNIGVTSLTGGTLDLDGNYLLNQPLSVPIGSLTLRGIWNNQSLILQTGGTINASGISGTNATAGQFVVSAGTLNVTTTNWTNSGTVTASGGLADLRGTWSNFGTVTASGGTVTTVSGTLSNLSSSTLTGGKWKVIGNGTLRFASAIGTVAADILLDGPGSSVYVGSSGATSALSDLAQVAGSGALSLRGGRRLVALPAFTNQGILNVEENSELKLLRTRLSGQLSLWSGEGNADDLIGGNHGTLTGETTFSAGQVGQGFSFDGVDDLVTTPLVMSYGGGASLSAWIRTTDTQAPLIAGGANGSGSRGMGLFIAPGGVLQFFGSKGTSGAPNFNLLGPVINDGLSHHVAATWDGTTTSGGVKLYLDGVQVGSATAAATITTDTHQLHLSGHTSFVSNGKYAGTLDEVGVYARALSAAEVLLLRNGGQPTVYMQSAGTTIVNGSLIADTVAVDGGALKGVGNVTGNVNNAGGTVAPGNSPGIMDIIGNYLQGLGGTLLLEVAGRDPDIPQFDRLRVTGTATLNGTVRAELLDDFEPTPGDLYRVLTAAQRVGRFATYDFPYPGGTGRQINPLYDDNGVPGLTLQTQNVPPVIFVAATTGGVADGKLAPEQVAFDLFGNSYVTGSFSGTVDFDREHPAASDMLTSSGTDGYIAKYDPTGQLIWVQPINGGGDALGAGIAIDHGNPLSAGDDLIYVTGAFAGTATYAGQTIAGFTQDVLLLQVDSSGALGAFTALPSGSTAVGRRVAVTTGGNPVIAGEFTGTLVSPAATLTSAGSTDAFVMEYSFSSGVVRAARLGGAGPDRGEDVALTAGGAVWFTGDFTGTTTGLAALTAAGNSATARTDAFLLRLSPAGSSFVAGIERRFGGEGNDTAAALAVDPAGNVMLGGNFEFSVDFDNATNKAFTLHSSGDHDAYVVKLADNGEFGWARSVGGYREDSLADLVTDAVGHIYATGEFRDRVDFDPLDGIHILATNSETTPEAFLSKLDAVGEFLWAVPLGDDPGAVSRGAGLDVSSAGRIAAVGQFTGTIDFDPTDLVSPRTFTPSVPGATAGYLSLLEQKAIPDLTILGLPAGAVLEGTTLALTAAVLDPDSIRFNYDWTVLRGGKPYATGRDATIPVPLVDQGVYTITLVVKDESGNRDTATATVIANNAPPAITSLSTSTASIDENESVTVSGSFSDPGVKDTHTVVIDWNDGSMPERVSLTAGQTTFSVTHQYLDDDPTATTSDNFNIQVRVQDDTLDVLAAKPAAGSFERYDGTTLFSFGQFVAAGAGGLSRPAAVAVGPNGDIYASSGAVGANPVLRFDGVTGAFVETFIAAGSNGTSLAADLTFGPDGNLYYLDGPGNRVLRYDGLTGDFLDVIVPAGSGGLADPQAVEFGPDGNLYVASIGSDSILRYSGSTGAFIDSLVTIDDPLDLAFGPDKDLFVLTTQPDSAVLRFDAQTGDALGTLANLDLSGTSGRLLFCGNNMIVVSDPGGPLLQFDTETGSQTGAANSNDGALAGLPLQAQVTATVTVNNTAPKVDVVSAATATAGEYTLTANIVDQGTRDTFLFAWTVTGATIVESASQQSVRVASSTGTFTLSLTVTDDDGNSSTFGVEVRIGTANDDSITVSNPAASINKVIVFGLAGNDTINASGVTTVPIELIGGFGDDTLIGGDKDDVLIGNNPGDYALGAAGDTGDDTLTGNAGNDILDGGLGDDTMTGGTGNDHYIEVPGSADVLIEGGADFGIDTIDYSQAFFGIHFSLATTDSAQVVNPTAPSTDQHTVEIQGDFENLVGSTFSDQLTGNSFSNELQGGTGDDALNGGAGDDIIFGGDDTDILLDDGDDTLDGGAGDDLLVGGSDDDVLIGDDGDDVIFGGDDTDILLDDGEDTLDGGAGNDLLVGGSNDDVLIGDDGDDVIFGGDDTDILLDDGDDTLDGGAGNDTLDGGLGDDVLIGGSDDDVLIGDDGDDVIFGGDDADILLDDGDDTLDGGAGDDTLDGGAGNDVLVGGSDDDVLIGDDGDDVIFGGDDTDILLDDGDDTLDGGAGNDVLTGGTGDDVLIGDDGDDVIFGGDDTDILLDDGDDTLDGGAGNDTLDGGLGDDVLIGGSDDDVLIGDDGNDVIFGGDDADILLDDGDDTLDGGAGDDTLDGGAGNDVLVGGSDDDVLIGDDGDDVIFGGPGDDELTGNAGLDVFEGGSGRDRIVESRDADMTLTPTQLTILGAPVEIHFDIELATLAGGASNNWIDASGFPGAVILFGLAGDDTLRGGPLGYALFGGSGNDNLFGNEGDDILDGGSGNDTLEGGDGNDRYLETPGSTDVLTDLQGIDSIDMGAAARGVNVDLGLNISQTIDSAGNVLLLNGTFENFRGTSFNDTIKGNAKRNVLEGGGGIDVLEGGADADTIQGSFTQLVYLDFVSASGPEERMYSVEERNAIQSRLERTFAAPLSISFTQTPPSIGRFSTIIVNAGSREDNEPLIGGVARELDWRNYNPGSVAAVNVNEFLGRRSQPAASSENFISLTTTVIAHELGHLLGLQHSDSFGPLGTGVSPESITRSVSQGEVVPGTPVDPPQPNSTAYLLRRGPIVLQPTSQFGNTTANPFQPPSGTVLNGTTAVASFTIDANGIVQVTHLGNGPPALVGGNLDPVTAILKLNWLTSTEMPLPAESSVVITYCYDAFRPGFRGPDDAHETSRHIMASPASVGSRIEDALLETYLSERELIKLAFADASTTVQESALQTVAAPSALGGAARGLGELPSLAVANLLPAGTVNFGKKLQVEAINVVGSIELSGGISQDDIYAFTGSAGERLTVEVLSAVLRHRLSDEIDATVSLRDQFGGLLNYYGQQAFNDDGFDSQDPLLLDVVLPTDGIYFIVVDTFTSATVSDRDTGEYELFVYKYTVDIGPRQGGSGDTLIGDGGPDVLIGSAGDDRFIGVLAEDQFLGFSEFDFLGPAGDPKVAPVANADSATVSEDTSNNVVDVLANDTDADNQSPTPANSGLTVTAVGLASHGTVSLAGGVVRYTPESNYNGPDSFSYTVSDPTGLTSTATVSLTITGVPDAPVANADSATVSEDTSNNVVDVLANDTDADNQSPTPANSGLTVTAVGLASHGAVSLVGGVVQYTPAANYNGPDSFSYTVSDPTGLTSVATVSLTITGVPDAPVANPDSAAVSEDISNNVVDVLTNDTDADNLSPTPANAGLTVTAVGTGSHGTVTLVGGVVQYTPLADYYGPDSFTYTVSDEDGPTSTATVNITVRAVNDAPSGANDALPNVFEDSGPWTIPFAALLANDSPGLANESSQTLTIVAVNQAVGGTVSIVGDNVIFTPADNYNGPASVTYTLRDDGQTNGADDFQTSTAVATFTLTQVNDPGTFGGKSDGSGAEDGGPITGTLTFADAADGYSADNFSVSTFAVHGTASIEAATGAWSYTPNLNHNGGDSFTVSVTDDDGNVEIQVISITVTQLDDSGTFGGNISGSGAEDGGLITGTLTFADAADGYTTPNFSVSVNAVHGTASFDTSTGVWRYTPDLNYNGDDSFTVSVTDDDGNVGSQFISIVVNQVNDSGTFSGDTTGTGNEGAGPITGMLTFADAADGYSAVNFSVSTFAAHGTTSIVASTGAWSYTPDLNYNGADSFAVSVIDDDGNIETQLISITLLPSQTPIANLISIVFSLGLGSGNTNALVSKLENAVDSFSRGNTTAGINKIESFQNQVQAFLNSGKLTQSQANDLNTLANTVIASAGTGGSAVRTEFDSRESDSESAQPITSAALLVSDTMWVALDAGSGSLTAEHRSGLQAAIAELNSKLGPYGVALTEMNNKSSDQPDIRITVAASSPCSGAPDGVLGCAAGAGDITLISGWNRYTGAASGAIGADQFDFRTVLTHELAHAIGLRHSSDRASVMYEMLAIREVRHNLTADDLVLLEEEAAGPEAEALLAAPLSGGNLSSFAANMVAAPVDSGNSVENTQTGTGDYTTFAMNDAALIAILAEWITGRAHSQRTSNFTEGTVAAGESSRNKDRSYRDY